MSDLIYKLEDLNQTYYRKISHIEELEHQIGRLSNFRDIVAECIHHEGDFIEFGSWQGFSLLWIAYFLERNANFSKRLLGLDGFIGLPYSDGVFQKGAFADTSLELCRKNLYGSPSLYPETKRNILIEQFLYSKKQDILAYMTNQGLKKFSFIHVDCDVSESANEIFQLLKDGDLIADYAFLLFDDYGCTSNLSQTVDTYLQGLQLDWTITVHSKTGHTKNFKLIRKPGANA